MYHVNSMHAWLVKCLPLLNPGRFANTAKHAAHKMAVRYQHPVVCLPPFGDTGVAFFSLPVLQFEVLKFSEGLINQVSSRIK